jgi:hypothetical protein
MDAGELPKGSAIQLRPLFCSPFLLPGGEQADLRTAALVPAIERVANVALARGIWP